MYRLRTTIEFHNWLASQTMKIQDQIHSRLERIEEYGHFGDAKKLGDSLAELRWKNGTRVYFHLSHDSHGNWMIVLLGGNKNSQRSDIKRAQKILNRSFSKE